MDLPLIGRALSVPAGWSAPRRR